MAGFGEEDHPTHLIDEFETAFQNCITQLTSQEYFNVTDSEETKTGVEHSLQKFLELARQTEAHFLSQRLILSTQKPDQVLREDIQDLKIELDRKEKLIEKHHDRLQSWQNLLRSMQGNTTGQPLPQQPPPSQPQASSQMNMQPMMQQQHPQQMSQYPGPPKTGPGMPAGPVPQNFMPPPQPPPSYPQGGPLAYLEQTMSNIGMPDRR
ncbi:mediator of RNA polymerase II transcription subunit 28-like [Gigantopelta aegis]|uniref:mediator of RNA polymerase II transcription subunit 28-like n=1 Tax=Gigantopelta aegis TaxID=1735272 RepID=UPI001B889429|nr:mediator of RNA polymerase II transcription subunit 28-like [Gigantopelta aegis]